MGLSEKQLQDVREKIRGHLNSGGSRDWKTAFDLLYPDRVTAGLFQLEFESILKPATAPSPVIPPLTPDAPPPNAE